MPRIRHQVAVLLAVGLCLTIATYGQQSSPIHDFNYHRHRHGGVINYKDLPLHITHSPNLPYHVPTEEPRVDPTTTTLAPPPPYCQPQRRETELTFARTGVTVLANDFLRSQDVLTLDLSENLIELVSSRAFRLAPNIEELDLSRNRLPTRNLLRLSNLPNLQRLAIDGNTDTTRKDHRSLDAEIFQPLPSLRELRLRKNGIDDIQLNFREFSPSLNKLDLSGNGLTSVDFLENAPTGLTHLNLADNSIKQLDPRMLGGLVELAVPGNRFTEICRGSCEDGSSLSLEGLTLLRKLDASRNLVASIADNAFQDSQSLNYLEELLLEGNKLTHIPNLCSMPRIRHVDLSGNTIYSVPGGSLCNSVTLKELLLNNNMITTVESGAINAPYLQLLNLGKNLIVELPVNWLPATNALRALMLSDNRITDLQKVWWNGAVMQMDVSAMRAWSTLTNLYLDGNPIPYARVSTVARFPPNLQLHFVNVNRLQQNDVVGSETKDVDLDYSNDAMEEDPE